MPVFLIVMFVVTVSPGTMARSAPYLLIVAQVAELVDTLPPSVERQVTVPALFFSSMIRVPVPAVFTLFWIDALKAANVGVMPSASTRDETPPAMRMGREALRFLVVVSDMRVSLGARP